LGLGEPFSISAEHGRGVAELVDALQELLVADSPDANSDDVEDELVEEDPNRPLRVAIVGRPNVGKSSLLNQLVGEKRAVVSDIPGTTRDTVDSLLVLDGHSYRLIDTAGIRRRGKIDRGVERFSVSQAQKAIDRCDVAILVLDGTEELAAQDLHIAGYVVDAHRPLVVAVNKWDVVTEREATARVWAERVSDRLRFAKQVPMVLISALSGQRVHNVLDRVREVWASSGIRVSTPDLNRWIERLGGISGGRGMHLLYGTQKGVHPPRFVFFCNDPKSIHFSTRRHIENSLRETFDFGASPLRLEFRSRRAPKGTKERR
jgi:GTP-binding protein